jgi:hypothetical protein
MKVIEGQTIHNIRNAVQSGALREPFLASDVNRALGIDLPDNLLPYHCEGDGYTTEHFVRIDRGLYKLRRPR